MPRAQHKNTDVIDGIKDALPILMAVAPFSAVFGAVAISQGFSFTELMLASASIYAVASQYVMVDLISQQVPAWSVMLSVFAINFRHVLYSAALGRHMQAFSFAQKTLAFFLLVDPQYAASEARATQTALRPSYYFSYAATVYITWMSANALGATFGTLIEQPEKFGIDFILPLYFMGLVAGFRQRPQFFLILAVSCVVSWLSYFTLGSPWHITLGGIAGLSAAALSAKKPETTNA